MKYSKGIIIAVVLSLIPVSIKAFDELYAVISDNTICLRFTPINDKLNDEVLSYNDTTYISVRDAAALSDVDVEWNADDKSITLHRRNDIQVVDTKEMAEEMGKALMSEYFGDVPECTVTYGYEDMYKTDFWRIEAVDDFIVRRFVLIDSYSGQFGVFEDQWGEITVLASSL